MTSTSDEKRTEGGELPTALVAEEPSNENHGSNDKVSEKDEKKKDEGKDEQKEKKGSFKDFWVLMMTFPYTVMVFPLTLRSAYSAMQTDLIPSFSRSHSPVR
jgi:hypothetical protein